MQLAKPASGATRALFHLLAALALGLLFALLGPFGSQQALSMPVRYGFWIGLVAFGYAAVAFAVMALRNSAGWRRTGPIVRLGIVAALSAVPTVFATAWVLTFVQTGRVVGIGDLPALFGAVLCVQAALALVEQNVSAWVFEPGTPAMPLASDETAGLPSMKSPSASRFMDRLPRQPGGELLALEAVDHYLRVHRAQGSTLVHMRLADAIDQLQGSDGLQVHRSWWVAHNAVIGQRRRGARTELVLANDVVAPVSRTFVMAVRRLAWPPLPN